MNHPMGSIALCASLLWLSACDKTPTTPPAPIVNTPVAAGPGATEGSLSDPSVPPVESVFPPASATTADQTPMRSNRSISEAQESTAMPMAGQNNDHSAPLGPAARASSP